jgi:hypothetical protein
MNKGTRLLMTAIVGFAVGCVVGGCDHACTAGKPFESCSEKFTCCPTDDNEPCTMTATRNAETRDFTCKTRDNCSAAIDQVVAFCD